MKTRTGTHSPALRTSTAQEALPIQSCAISSTSVIGTQKSRRFVDLDTRSSTTHSRALMFSTDVRNASQVPTRHTPLRDVLSVSPDLSAMARPILPSLQSLMIMAAISVQRDTTVSEVVLLKFLAHQELTTHSKASQRRKTADSASQVPSLLNTDGLAASHVVNSLIQWRAPSNASARVSTEPILRLMLHADA